MKVNAVLVLLTCLVLMTCIAGLEGKGLKRKSGKSLISSKKVSFRPGSKPKIDLCSGRCHKDATCITKGFLGKCQCNKGYSGDGKYNCIMRSRPDPKPQIDLCSGKCHKYATCVKTVFGKGKCQCNKGYSGDGENNCIMRSRPDPKPQIDLCFGKCHKYATCVKTMFGKGPCRCNKGYIGDGVNNCIKQCGKNRQACHKDAECIRGKKTSVCRCKAGMKGDGIHSCSDVCECRASEECVAFNGEYVCRPLPTVKPTTRAPTTRAPTTKAPTTRVPTTKAPTNKAPTTNAPTTKASTTKVPPTTTPSKKPKLIKECREPDDLEGKGYWGSQNTATSGRRCQLWASNTPHKHGLRNLLQGEGQFCRNMGKRVRELPWCFTDDINKRWEYCDNIPICGQDTKIQVPPKETGCFDVMDKGEHSYNSVTSLMNWGRSGRVCSKWSDKGYSLYGGNFCRNPYGAKSSPWCFIDSEREWEYCSVPQCYKPPPTPKEVASHCIISEETDACLTRIELCGNCYYSYKFNAECAFTAVTTSSARKAQLYLTDNSTVTLTTPGAESKYFGCANVSLDSDCLTITMSTCGWCLKQSVASFMSNDRNKCPAP